MKTFLQKSTFVFFFTMLCFVFVQQASAQAVSGDFRSTATGNWSTSTTWQRYNGATWDASGVGSNNPGQTPTATSSVWIQTAHVVTLTANESCNDLHIASSTTATPSGTTLGKIGLATFTLSVNGKMRNYYGTLNTIPGTNQSAGFNIYPFTGTTGKVSIVGTTRTVFASAEWGATITNPATGTFPLEVNLNDNAQTATFSSNTKSSSFNLVTGIVSGATISTDNGTTAQGNVTIASGTTLISSATSSNVFQKSGSVRAGTLTIAGTLRFTGGTPRFSMNSVSNTGTIEYSNAGTQTFITATNSGANMTYNNLVISGSGVKTTALATSVTGATTVDTGCTLATSTTLTLVNTPAINGSFQLNAGGWATGGTWNYGTTGTLVFANATGGSYGVNNDVFWPVTNGPVNVTVSGAAGITMNVARTVPASGTTGVFLLSSPTSNAIAGTALTLNGTTQINAGGTFSSTPTYGSASKLVYNATYTTNNEWTGGASTSVAAGSGIPANVQVLSSVVTLSGGRGVPGNVTITAGGMVLNATSGDLYLGGNLTHSGTTWTNNGRAVVFVGTGTSVINTSANSGVHFFEYLLVNKSSGTVQIGSTTNVTLNTTAGSVLQFLNAGTLDLNGRTLTMNNNGGNILVDGTTGGTSKSIISSTGTGIIAVTNGKTASGTAGGTLSTDSNVNWILTGGMNFGGVTTVNGTLQINVGGFVTANAPIYGTGSLLKYNSAANPFNRTTEWSASSGAGYPYNVQISNNTTLSPGGSGNTGTALNVANNLTIDSGSAIYMDYGGNSMSVPLTVNNDLTLSGSLSASGATGGDIIVKGNWNKTGSFFPNARAVFFQGTNAQTFTGATTFDYVLIDKTAGSFTLINDLTANQTLTFTGANTVSIATGGNKVVISNTGGVTRTGAGHVNGYLQKNIPTGTNSRTFEIGSSSEYTPVTLDYSGVSGAGNVTANTTNNDHPQIASSGIDGTRSANRFYTLANSGVAGGSYDATFTFVSGDLDSGVLTSAFGISSYVNPTWTTATIGTRTITTTQATGVTTYGDFQLGEGQTTWTGNAGTTTWSTLGNWSNGVPTSTSNVVIDSASFYPVLTSDITINSLRISTGSVTVPTLFDLTVTDAIVNNGTLNIANNANLIQTNNVANTGTGLTAVSRNSSLLYRLDYTLWSSPVSGQKLFDFSPLTSISPTVRFYTYSNSGDIYSSVASPSTTDFATGTGYLIRMPYNWPTYVSPSTPGTSWTGTFQGTPNNGNIPVTILNGGNGFNAIGNPYPSAVSIGTFLSNNTGSIDPTLWFWRRRNLSGASAYVTFTSGTYSTGSQPVNNLEPGQGFIVKYKTAGTGTVNFYNTQRVGTDGIFLRNNNTATTVTDASRIWLNLVSQDEVVGNMAFGYKEGATNGIEQEFDGEYINDGAIALNSIVDNTELAVQHRATPFLNTDVVPLSFKTDLAGTYSIAINEVDGLFTGGSQAIYLRDNLTATLHDLNSGSYSFVSDAGNFNSRFEIVYQSQLGVGTPNFTANNVIIFNQNNEFVINSGNVLMASIKIFDIRGRLLLDKKGINASQTTLNVGLATEVLLVQVTSIDGEMITKKVVR